MGLGVVQFPWTVRSSQTGPVTQDGLKGMGVVRDRPRGRERAGDDKDPGYGDGTNGGGSKGLSKREDRLGVWVSPPKDFDPRRYNEGRHLETGLRDKGTLPQDRTFGETDGTRGKRWGNLGDPRSEGDVPRHRVRR